MRFTLERTTSVRRTPGEVYAFLAEIGNHPRFVESVVSMRALAPGPLQVGTPLEVVRALPGIHAGRIRSRYEVSALEPDRRFGFTGALGPLGGTGEYLIEPDGSTGARVTLRVSATTSAGLAILAPLIRRFLEHDATGNLASLKRVLESER